MSRERDKVSQNVVSQLIKMSLENAETFLNDARLLINNASFGHAFALIILAFEEVGKAVYCNWGKNGLVKVDKDFAKRLKNHKVKQRVLKELEKLAILDREIKRYQKNKRRKYPFKSDTDLFHVIATMPHFKSIDALYEQFDKVKQLALYVDIGEKGVPSTPNFFTRDICDKYLDFVQKRLISAKAALSENKNEEFSKS